jgi:hypothetical protein
MVLTVGGSGGDHSLELIPGQSWREILIRRRARSTRVSISRSLPYLIEISLDSRGPGQAPLRCACGRADQGEPLGLNESS